MLLVCRLLQTGIGKYYSFEIFVNKAFEVKPNFELLPSLGLQYRNGKIDFDGVTLVNEFTEVITIA